VQKQRKKKSKAVGPPASLSLVRLDNCIHQTRAASGLLTPVQGYKVIMGVDLQPDGLTAGLAGHCQLDKNIHSLRKKKK